MQLLTLYQWQMALLQSRMKINTNFWNRTTKIVSLITSTKTGVIHQNLLTLVTIRTAVLKLAKMRQKLFGLWRLCEIVTLKWSNLTLLQLSLQSKGMMKAIFIIESSSSKKGWICNRVAIFNLTLTHLNMRSNHKWCLHLSQGVTRAIKVNTQRTPNKWPKKMKLSLLSVIPWIAGFTIIEKILERGDLMKKRENWVYQNIDKWIMKNEDTLMI